MRTNISISIVAIIIVILTACNSEDDNLKVDTLPVLTDVKLFNTGYNTLTVLWDSQDNTDSYNVYWSTDRAFPTDKTTYESLNTTIYVFRDVKPEDILFIKVSSLFEDIEMKISAIIVGEFSMAIENSPPTANAGSQQTVELNHVVQLDGTKSSDIETEDKDLKYLWSPVSAIDYNGNPIAIDKLLSRVDESTPIFTPIEAGVYKFSLVINDGIDNSTSEEYVEITIFEIYQYAYIPDLRSSSLYVYNTGLNRVVDKISLIGKPLDVHVNKSGSHVFVSTINSSESYVNVIDTTTNEVMTNGIISIESTGVRGMALTSDGNRLFVTHEQGITVVEKPGTINTLGSALALTYSGAKIAISDDDKYLFIIGIDSFDNDGISVVDIDTFSEIATYNFGKNNGSTEIVFDNNNSRLYIANSTSDQVVAINVINYEDVQALSLEYYEERNFNLGSNPVDLQLNKLNTELYVVFSFIQDNMGTGNGNIVILSSDNISSTANEVSVFFSNENSSAGTSIIHPLAVNIDSEGKIIVLKQIWSDTTGLYVTQLSDTTGENSGIRQVRETQSFNLGGTVSTITNGVFLGPKCPNCPTGIE